MTRLALHLAALLARSASSRAAPRPADLREGRRAGHRLLVGQTASCRPPGHAGVDHGDDKGPSAASS